MAVGTSRHQACRGNVWEHIAWPLARRSFFRPVSRYAFRFQTRRVTERGRGLGAVPWLERRSTVPAPRARGPTRDGWRRALPTQVALGRARSSKAESRAPLFFVRGCDGGIDCSQRAHGFELVSVHLLSACGFAARPPTITRPLLERTRSSAQLTADPLLAQAGDWRRQQRWAAVPVAAAAAAVAAAAIVAAADLAVHVRCRHEQSSRRAQRAQLMPHERSGSRRAARGCGSARAAGGGAPRVCRGRAQRGRRPPPSASLRRPG